MLGELRWDSSCSNACDLHTFEEDNISVTGVMKLGSFFLNFIGSKEHWASFKTFDCHKESSRELEYLPQGFQLLFGSFTFWCMGVHDIE